MNSSDPNLYTRGFSDESATRGFKFPLFIWLYIRKSTSGQHMAVIILTVK